VSASTDSSLSRAFRHKLAASFSDSASHSGEKKCKICIKSILSLSFYFVASPQLVVLIEQEIENWRGFAGKCWWQRLSEGGCLVTD
jgi:hypothetical protein